MHLCLEHLAAFAVEVMGTMVRVIRAYSGVVVINHRINRSTRSFVSVMKSYK